LVRFSVQASTREHQPGPPPPPPAVFLDGGIAQQQRTAQAFGQRQRNLLRPPDHLDQLLADDHAAHGDQDLLEVLAVDRPHDEALERQAHRAGHQPWPPAWPAAAPPGCARARRAGPVAHGASTLVATKAPSAMNTPWPKFSTSIRPNTSVRPEAMMKMIMPMARPATVSVSQVDPSRPAAARQGQQRHQGQGLPVEVERSCRTSLTREFFKKYSCAFRRTLGEHGWFMKIFS
jgi:hypothetical protein